MSRPSNYYYTESHEWINVEDGIASIGITDYAVKALRDLVALDIEVEDGDVAVGDCLAVIESVKAASDIDAPVAGEVIEVNDELVEDIDILGGDAFGAGWMIKIKLSDPEQISNLLSLEDYEKTLEG